MKEPKPRIGPRTFFPEGAGRLSLALLFLLLGSQAAFCRDPHHFSSGRGPGDPHDNAFAMGIVLITVSSTALLLLGTPLAVVCVKRIRDILWMIPGINIVLYLFTILWCPYPGGFLARFQAPGIYYTGIEISVLLVVSGLLALMAGVIAWTWRKLRSLRLRNRMASGPGPTGREPEEAGTVERSL